MIADLDPNLVGVTLPRFHDPARRLEALQALEKRDVATDVATVLGLGHLAATGTALAEPNAPFGLLAASPSGDIPARWRSRRR